MEVIESEKVSLSMPTPILPSIESNAHIWLVDSAASSHVCGNANLFEQLHMVPAIFIETASGDSCIANKKGMVHIMLCSHLSHQLPDVPIMLTDVIYLLNLNANLLSVGCMTTAGVIVTFNKLQSSLSIDDNVFAHGPKLGNLFTFNAVPTGITNEISCHYAMELTEMSLWHHRLAHINYSTLEKMSKHRMLSGLPSNMTAVHPIQCVNCPFGKQVRAPFKQIEESP